MLGCLFNIWQEAVIACCLIWGIGPLGGLARHFYAGFLPEKRHAKKPAASLGWACVGEKV
ncbi:MAG: hypothetical protein ACXVJP_15820 [Mucilaginibacter sp.]